MNSKKNLLLKKSFKVRKILDILVSSPFVIICNVEKYSNEKIEILKKELSINDVNFFLINKDSFLNKKIGFVARGVSIIFYSKKDFLNKFLFLDGWKQNIILLKYFNIISLDFYKNILQNKYKMLYINVSNFLFFILYFYKNIIFFLSYILKHYFLKLIGNFLLFQVKFLKLLNYKIK